MYHQPSRMAINRGDPSARSLSLTLMASSSWGVAWIEEWHGKNAQKTSENPSDNPSIDVKTLSFGSSSQGSGESSSYEKLLQWQCVSISWSAFSGHGDVLQAYLSLKSKVLAFPARMVLRLSSNMPTDLSILVWSGWSGWSGRWGCWEKPQLFGKTNHERSWKSWKVFNHL